jgi:hypothetical protein
MIEFDLIMDTLGFEEGASHMDVLNTMCRGLFEANKNLLLIRVYKNDQHYQDKNMLGRIFRPGHAGYYQDCGEVVWKYLRSVENYVVDGDQSDVCNESE